MTMVQHEIRKVFAATATKGTGGTNIFTVSTGEVDRDGDTLDPNGWELVAFKTNPVVLYNHSRSDLPIAKCVDVRVVGGKLKATVAWPPAGVYPFADQVHALVDEGFLNAASVGFRSTRSDPNQYGGRDHHGQELCEFSLVPIPSNPSALVERGLNRMQLKSWLGMSRHAQHKEDEMDSEMWLEIDDGIDTKDDDPFQAMCDRMLEAYSEMDSAKFRELMARQLATLGPAGKIDDFVRAMCRDGVVASRNWTPEYDIDEKELATLIGRVIADEIPRAARAAFNTALGRLD